MVAGLALGMLVPAPAQAQTNGVSLSCTGSDICDVSVSTAAPGPLHYGWTFNNNGLSVIYPANCTDKDSCMFYCPRTQGNIQVNVTVSDANYQFVGSASSMAFCTAEPL